VLWVAGGRTCLDAETIRRELTPYFGWVLVTGSARGADLIAEHIWREMERPYIGVPARWEALQRRAGVARNENIAAWWKPDRLLAFPGGRGTEHAKSIAQRLGIDVVEVGA